MSLAPTLYYVLWFLELCLLGLIAGVMYCRKLHSKYPFFFAYSLFDIFRIFLQFVLFRLYGPGSPIYFAAYWTLEALGLTLEFAVIYEVFTHLAAPYPAFRSSTAAAFRWVGAVLLLAASVTALFLSAIEPGQLTALFMVVERTLRIAQTGMLLLLLAAGWYFGLSLRSKAFGIVLGFGLFGAVQVAIWVIRLQAGRVAHSTLNLLQAADYVCTFAVWLIYMAQPEPEVKPLPILPKTDIEEWNAALRELIRR